MEKGKLFVVSGPSGAGKSTVCKLVRKILRINLAVSATTRQPRSGEKDGMEYHFLSTEEFEKKVKNNEFFDYVFFYVYYYRYRNMDVYASL